MRVLALDPGVSLGWAVVAPNEVEHSGEHSLKKHGDRKHWNASDRHAAYFDRCSNIVTRLMEDHQPEAVLIEEMVGSMKGEASRVLLGIRATALIVCRRRGAMPLEVNNSKWSGWARHRGYVKGDDGDDALWMARYWIECEMCRLQVAA